MSKKRNRKFKLQLHEVDFNRSRLVTYYGNIGEIIAQEVLKKQGFEVWLPRPVANEKNYISFFSLKHDEERLSKLRRHYDRLKNVYGDDIKETWQEYRDEYYGRHNKTLQKIEAFFSDKLEAFRQYSKKLGIDEYRYFPDLIAKKNGEIYMIEVKSSKRARKQYLKGKKLRGLMLAREFGFTPMVITLKVHIEATEFELEEL